MSYAKGTTVSRDRTIGQIEGLLIKHGAIGFLYGWIDTKATLQFQMEGKHLRFELPLPDIEESRHTQTGRLRKGNAYKEEHEKEIRCHR